jgi:hypothetical protein
MKHEEAWIRLPDLLDDRDDPTLLAHVRSCGACQRQLFLLGRVDRLLGASAAERRARQRGPRGMRRAVAAAAAVAVAAVVTVAALLGLQAGPRNELTFRTASGRAVAKAVMGPSDARNVSLALTARDLPVERGQVFVLWARGQARAPMQVGRFMVDRSGGCRARFNLPGDARWGRFWITRSGAPASIVAET